MQGTCNVDIAKTFLSTQKLEALCLQECRITTDNASSFKHKLYNTHILQPDLVTFIRKDIKSELITQSYITDIPILTMEIQGEDSWIILHNAYAQDNTLTLSDLENTLNGQNNSIYS